MRHSEENEERKTVTLPYDEYIELKNTVEDKDEKLHALHGGGMYISIERHHYGTSSSSETTYFNSKDEATKKLLEKNNNLLDAQNISNRKLIDKDEEIQKFHVDLRHKELDAEKLEESLEHVKSLNIFQFLRWKKSQ